MATKKVEVADKSPVIKKAEYSYDVQDLIAGAESVFHMYPDIVATALRLAKVEHATISEATKIVTAFATQEVK